MTVQPRKSREVRLARHPHGTPQAQDFSIVEATLPPAAANEALVRNRWFRISPSVRLMASADAQHIKGIPFPPLMPGDTLADAAVGEVIEAPADGSLRRGDLVLHRYGWRDYALAPADSCLRLDDASLDPAAWLGHGWTAYAALTRGLQIRPGDTVLVTSGAGAIGSMAGQIARRLGAGRVIGSTGSHDKAAWMQAALGYDAVLIRGATPIAEQLAAAAPDGIDVCIDMVGGEQLQAAAAAAREGARFVLLGALTAELAAGRATMLAPVELDSFRLIVKGVSLRGYSADSDPDAFMEWLRHLAQWSRDGGMALPRSTFVGLDSAPQALHEACTGRLKGVVLVELP